MVELRPCPFCGGEASDAGHIRYSRPLVDTTWEDGSPITEAFHVNCIRCGQVRAPIGIVGGYQTRGKAIAAWNTRAPVDVSDDQIKHMAYRFLGWMLPENFNPDGGISFDGWIGNKGIEGREYRRHIRGTNLFDYTQAVDMVRYMVEGLPDSAPGEVSEAMVEAGIEALHLAEYGVSFPNSTTAAKQIDGKVVRAIYRAMTEAKERT